jgi:hypothetical protein
MRLHRVLSTGLLGVAVLSPSIVFSGKFSGLSYHIEDQVGLYVPPILFSFLVLFGFSLYLHRVKGFSLPLITSLLAVLYALPYLGGVPRETVRFVTLSALPLGLAVPFVPYVHSISVRTSKVRGYPSSELGAIIQKELGLILTAMGPGILLLGYLLYSTNAGESPLGLFPTYFVPIFAILIGLLLSMLEKGVPNDVRTVLVLRARMLVGDTFRVSMGSEWEKGYEINLEGGNPVRREVLLKFDVDKLPDYVLLKSLWDREFLTKKMETVEGNVRYVLFMPTSHAPSSRDTSSAPP